MIKKIIKEFDKKAGWLKEGIVYHRGKHNSIVKENTLEAIKGAMDDNLAVEIDVRLTKDLKVAVSHDDSLKRVFNVEKKISELSYEEVCQVTNNGVPLLTDVFNLVDDKIPLMIEIKSGNSLLKKKVYELLKNYKGRYVIVCFNPFILRYFRKKDSSIIRGQLSHSFNNSKHSKLTKFLLSRMMLNVFSKPHFISYGINECNTKLLAKYKKKGYFIIGWTYKDERNREILSKIFDNMIVEELSIREF